MPAGWRQLTAGSIFWHGSRLRRNTRISRIKDKPRRERRPRRKNEPLTETTESTEDNFSVDTARSLKSSTATPTERQISNLVFLSVGIPLVSRWLTIATSAWRRQLLSASSTSILIGALGGIESSRSSSLEHRA